MKTENKVSHTPGPWQVKQTKSLGMGILIGADLPVCYINTAIPEYKEAEANARLIAESPQLLKAAEFQNDLINKCIDVLGKHILPDSKTTDTETVSTLLGMLDNRETSIAFHAAGKTIAKAKGETQS